jgi:hypothetical protein
MHLLRFFRHALLPAFYYHRKFSHALRLKVRDTVAVSELQHGGEIVVAFEGRLSWSHLLLGQSPRARALEVFGQLGVWDTEHNCGVLLYILWADHKVEILADRGIARVVPAAVWQHIAGDLARGIGAGQFDNALLVAVERTSALLIEHFPQRSADKNELNDLPRLL